MKGAMALLSVKTISPAKIPNPIKIGSNQYRFLILKNSQNSLMVDWFDMVVLLNIALYTVPLVVWIQGAAPNMKKPPCLVSRVWEFH